MVHSLPTTKENCSIPIPKQDEGLVETKSQKKSDFLQLLSAALFS